MQSTEQETSFLSDRIIALAESQTIAMAKKARELAAQGHDVINLSFGEPDFQTPQYIKDAAKKALDDGFTFYTPVAGYLDLRQEIVAKLKRDNNLDYKPENIVVSTGAKQSIANVVMSFGKPRRRSNYFLALLGFLRGGSKTGRRYSGAGKRQLLRTIL